MLLILKHTSVLAKCSQTIIGTATTVYQLIVYFPPFTLKSNETEYEYSLDESVGLATSPVRAILYSQYCS